MKRLLLILGLLVGISQAQTTTTITGTIKDLSQALVTSGKVTFTLQPSRDTTISGLARFSPAQVVCLINASGLIKAQDGTSVCTLTMNTALNPPGTYYRVDVWPFNVKTSSFTFYAVLSTYDWSTVVPTPTTSPAQNFVDIFSNQTIGGAKTWSGAQTFNGAASFTAGLSSTTGSFVNSGAFSNAQMNLYLQSLLNSCSPSTEFHSNFGGSSNATEGLTGCLSVPASSTVFQANAVSGYVNNSSGAATGAVAVFGNARTTVTAGGRIWGGNFVATGFAGLPSNSLYSTENDCNPANTLDVCHGMLVAGNFTAQPVTTDGITIAAPGQFGACTVCTWPYGIRFAQGATTTVDASHAAIVFFPIANGTSQPSQGIAFLGSSGGGTADLLGAESLDINGNLAIVTGAANSGILLNSKQVTRTIASGTATMTTAAIGAGACGTTVTVAATGALTTDSVNHAFNSSVAANPGQLTFNKWPTANNVNFNYCNPTAGSITPSAATVNWTVTR